MDKAERQKMQEKLNRQYIDFKLNPMIEPMVISYVQNIETNPEPVSKQNDLNLTNQSLI